MGTSVGMTKGRDDVDEAYFATEEQSWRRERRRSLWLRQSHSDDLPRLKWGFGGQRLSWGNRGWRGRLREDGARGI